MRTSTINVSWKHSSGLRGSDADSWVCLPQPGERTRCAGRRVLSGVQFGLRKLLEPGNARVHWSIARSACDLKHKVAVAATLCFRSALPDGRVVFPDSCVGTTKRAGDYSAVPNGALLAGYTVAPVAAMAVQSRPMESWRVVRAGIATYANAVLWVQLPYADNTDAGRGYRLLARSPHSNPWWSSNSRRGATQPAAPFSE